MGREQVRQRAREDARGGAGHGDDGDVRRGAGGDGGGRCARWVEAGDDGAQVVDEGFAGPGDEEEAGGQPPHGVVGEEAARFGVEEPGLFAVVVGGAVFGAGAGVGRALFVGGEMVVVV